MATKKIGKHALVISEALCHLRYSKQCEYVVSEFMKCDALGIKGDVITEYEIKLSINDLKNELKKPKHSIYNSLSRKFKPTYFYIVIPKHLVEKAIIWVTENIPHAGVISYEPATYKGYKIRTHMLVKKRAKKLNSKKLTEKQTKSLIKRIVSSMLQTKIKELNL